MCLTKNMLPMCNTPDHQFGISIPLWNYISKSITEKKNNSNRLSFRISHLWVKQTLFYIHVTLSLKSYNVCGYVINNLLEPRQHILSVKSKFCPCIFFLNFVTVFIFVQTHDEFMYECCKKFSVGAGWWFKCRGVKYLGCTNSQFYLVGSWWYEGSCVN